MLQQHGSVLYNGEGFKAFFPERTAAYVDQVGLQLTLAACAQSCGFCQLLDPSNHCSSASLPHHAGTASSRTSPAWCDQSLRPTPTPDWLTACLSCIQPRLRLPGWHRWTTTSLT